MMFMCKRENGYKCACMLRIVKKLRPTIATHRHAASKAVGPVIAVGNAVVVFEEQRHEDVF